MPPRKKDDQLTEDQAETATTVDGSLAPGEVKTIRPLKDILNEIRTHALNLQSVTAGGFAECGHIRQLADEAIEQL